MFHKPLLTATASIVFLGGCNSHTKMSADQCTSLIRGVTEIPHKRDLSALGNYPYLIEKTGDKNVTNCLLDHIVDLTQMPDPRGGPGRRKSVAFGDVSVFMLTEIYDIPFTTFMDSTEWQNMGIYAYFEYVETDGARDEIAKILREQIVNSGKVKLHDN